MSEPAPTPPAARAIGARGESSSRRIPKRFIATAALICLCCAPVGAADEDAAADARVVPRSVVAQLQRADENAALGEADAAQAAYEQLLAKHGKGPARFTIRLRLGRLHFKLGRYDKAAEHFTRAAADASGRGEQNPDLGERVEALFHVGMCAVKLGQPERCFPSFRQVIELAPGTDFANQAYFQIAEAHYAKGNFTQAIANYQLVGTSLDADQLASRRAELGKPLFVRVRDQDFLIMDGKPVAAEVAASDGDRETVTLRPLRPGSDTYVGLLPTGLGAAKPGDGVLTAAGGATVTVSYVDGHTASGQLDITRSAELALVAEGRVAITDGAFRDPISQVILDHGAGSLNLRVVDFDRDTGDAADRVTVEVVVERPVPKDETGEPTAKDAKPDAKDAKPAAADADAKEEERWHEVARATATLTETVIAPRGEDAPGADAGPGVRTGSFTATLALAAAPAAQAIVVALGDRVTVVYRDERHLAGDAPVARQARALVVPGSASNLQVAGTSLEDPNLLVRKELLSAETAMRIGEVYRDMGLDTHAQRRFDEALDACRRVGQVKGTYERELHEQTLHALWRIYLAKGALDDAARACQTLQTEFPDSDYIADSLLAMAKAADLAGQPQQAVQIYQQIASLPKGSILAAEALFRVGQVYERQIERIADGHTVKDAGMRQQAINAFRRVFTAYPDSTFASDALKRIGDYYLDDGNWNQAIDFFEQILRDYPDAPFLADVLYGLGVGRGLKGDYPASLAAFARLEREYPAFERMDKARSFRQGIEKKLAAKTAKAAKPDAAAAPAPGK